MSYVSISQTDKLENDPWRLFAECHHLLGYQGGPRATRGISTQYSGTASRHTSLSTPAGLLIQSVDVFGDQLFQHQYSWIYTIIICRKPLITSTIRYISCIHLCALKAKVLQGFREARSILILPGEAAAVRPVDHCRDLWEHFVPTLAIYINTELIGSMDGHRKSIQLWSYNSGDCL